MKTTKQPKKKISPLKDSVTEQIKTSIYMTPPNSNENNTPDNPIDLTSDKEDNILTKNPYNISGLTTIPTTESCNRYGNDVIKLEIRFFLYSRLPSWKRTS